MKLLIIGGTSFLGRATAVDALARGWEVTTFNRGKSAPDVDGVEVLRGDRDDDAALEQLAGRTFDVVVDTCGFVPRVVAKSVRATRGVRRALRLRLEHLGDDHLAGPAHSRGPRRAGLPVGRRAGRR